MLKDVNNHYLEILENCNNLLTQSSVCQNLGGVLWLIVMINLNMKCKIQGIILNPFGESIDSIK